MQSSAIPEFCWGWHVWLPKMSCQGKGGRRVERSSLPEVDRVCIEGNTVASVEGVNGVGERISYPGDYFFSSMPVRDLVRAASGEVRKRSKFLSITHKLHSDHDAQFYVGESRHTSPNYGVARWGIVCASEIAT
jgi:hypothetical protein